MEAGVFYIFHGEDEFGRTEYLGELREQVAGGDRAMADLNTSALDGKDLSLGELRHHCDSVPFLYDRRLVMVDGLLSRLFPRQRQRPGVGDEALPARNKEYLQGLVEYLPSLPPTTRLFFLESETLHHRHPVLSLARTLAGARQAVVREFSRPKDRDLPGWIQHRAEERGARIEPRAVHMLTTYVGNDLRLLDSELEKLFLYTEGARPVTDEDVELLVSQVREANIFHMVDAIGRREAGPALELLHRMLGDDEPPLRLLSMITRQFRLLLQVKDLGRRGLPQPAIVKELKLHPYVADKLLQQARTFSLDQLDAAFDRLAEADWAIKTGRAAEVLALDLLVVDLTRLGVTD